VRSALQDVAVTGGGGGGLQGNKRNETVPLVQAQGMQMQAQNGTGAYGTAGNA